MIEIASLVRVLRMVSVCIKCQQSELDIFDDASTRVPSASCLLIRCGVCMNSQTLWSVSGQFGESKDHCQLVRVFRPNGIRWRLLLYSVVG